MLEKQPTNADVNQAKTYRKITGFQFEPLKCQHKFEFGKDVQASLGHIVILVRFPIDSIPPAKVDIVRDKNPYPIESVHCCRILGTGIFYARKETHLSGMGEMPNVMYG